MNERQRAARVGAVVELVSVSLRRIDARLPAFGLDDAGVAIDLNWETGHERSTAEDLRYTYRLALSTLSGPDFHIECELELIYRLPEGFGADDADLEAFGEVSVSFSAFPYARELVQSLTTRASLPPLVLGTLRAPIDPPGPSYDEDAEEPPS